jgi:putative ABC transport system permease protein
MSLENVAAAIGVQRVELRRFFAGSKGVALLVVLRQPQRVHRCARHCDGHVRARVVVVRAARGELGLCVNIRDMWMFRSLDAVFQDATYALRTLRSQPGMATTIVVVLAAVIGLNTTLFTVLAGVVWRPWPGVANPDEIVRLYLADQSRPASGFSLADARLLDRATSLAGTAVMRNETVRIGAGDAIAAREALLVSDNFFDLLGIRFVHGRGFRDFRDRLAAPTAVAVINYLYWQSRLGGDPRVVGSTLRINDVLFTVVGVLAPDFGSAEPAYDKSVFLPVSALTLLHPDDPSYQRVLHDSDTCCADVVARVAPAVTRATVRTELDVLARGFTSFSGNAAAGVIVTGTEFLSQPGRGDSSQALTSGVLLVLALLLVWLIACANVGNLLLSRAAARVAEIGTRLALGASRRRIVGQLLIEGLLLALVAGAAGVAVAYQLPFVLFRVVADSGTTGFFPFRVTPDAAVLGYAVVLAGLSSVVFGLAPALYVARADVVAWLKCRDAFPATKLPLRSALLAAQVAVSITLLLSAGLLIRGVQRQAGSYDPGFTVADVTALQFELPEGVYNRERTTTFFADIALSVRALPIEAAAFAARDPFSRYRDGTLFHLPGESRQQAKMLFFLNVSPEYFTLLGIPLRAGRYFEEADLTGTSVIVNETMARRFWPGGNAVGQTFFMRPRGPVDQLVIREIVGVVRDVRSTTSSNVAPMFYQPVRAGSDVFDFVSRDPRASQAPILLLKTQADVTDAVRRIAARIDPRVRVSAVRLTDSLDAMLATARWGPILAATLGLFALALTTVGLSGVFAYAVRQSRREIGIRMALGAQPAAVVRLVLARHTRALAAGLLVGLVGSVAAALLLRSRLHGLSPFDPIAYVSVAALLALCALAAGFLPARRATEVNPLETLRQL